MIPDIIGGMGVLVMSGSLFVAWRTAKHVGHTNGSGTLAEMMESLMVSFGEHLEEDRERFDSLTASLQTLKDR